MRKILVTSALPYANGEIHLGHLVEYIQTDIWVRIQKILGNKCYYICADDAHGTPIMLKAKELGITPDELINAVAKRHIADFNDFDIDFSNYYSTHSKENKQLATEIYNKLFAKGYITTKIISQAFDKEQQMFLPDRFIKGDCPKCGANDQYGDNCEKCGATYNPTDLINAKSVLSGVTPIQKDSEHYFFDLPQFEKFLKNWTKKNMQVEMSNKLNEWFKSGLQKWDISRDAPYFGFKIPNTVDKFFYVWLDAPIGYMASFKNLCVKENINFDEFWQKNSTTELYHFIGKDIMYFHSLFWPAILTGANYRTPTAIFTHGFLTINGKKMSKSRGTFITARKYLDNLNSDYLRYYYAYKLNNNIDDIDLNLIDFKQRVNSDLVGKVANIASRTAGFIIKKFDKTLSKDIIEQEIYNDFIAKGDVIKIMYEKRNYSQAMREIMHLADIANGYIAKTAPWSLIKDINNQQQVHNITTLAINLFRIIITYLSPVLPKTAAKAKDFLNLTELNWHQLKQPLVNHKINNFKPLINRIEDVQLTKITN